MSDAPDTPRHDISFVDAYGITISAYAWLPEAAPLGAVQIAHGIGEHALRYEAFARALVNAGFAVYADDHRGHGETGRNQFGGDLSKLGHLGPGGLRAAEDAIRQFTGIIRERHPGLPLAQFGHSLGSLMTQRILNAHPHLWDAVILSGTAYRTPRHMESGALNARWANPRANGFEWLSRDPEVSQAFIADSLCFEADVLRLFGVADGLRLFGRPGRGLDPDIPILIIGGTEDPLSRGVGISRLAAAYRSRGVRDVTVQTYRGARHELLNETNRDEVIAYLLGWLREHVAR